MINALNIDWGRWNHIYLFPPRPLILTALFLTMKDQHQIQTTKVTVYTNFNIQSKTTAGSSRQTGKRHKDFQNSCLEVLRAANELAFPFCDEETISLMTKSIRKSSEEDYQKKWTTFLNYVHSKGLSFEDINRGLEMNFFVIPVSYKKIKTFHYISLPFSSFKILTRLLWI